MVALTVGMTVVVMMFWCPEWMSLIVVKFKLYNSL